MFVESEKQLLQCEGVVSMPVQLGDSENWLNHYVMLQEGALLIHEDARTSSPILRVVSVHNIRLTKEVNNCIKSCVHY